MNLLEARQMPSAPGNGLYFRTDAGGKSKYVKMFAKRTVPGLARGKRRRGDCAFWSNLAPAD